MSFRILSLTAFFIIGSVGCLTAAKPRLLFDGESLENWSFDAKHWRVENGAIVGEIPPGQTLSKNTWIIWNGELEDFDLRLRCKLTGAPSANSGIQFRAQADDPDHVSGYQADLDKGQTWLGRIYDEHGRALIVERGQRVLIHEDGRRTVETFAPAGLFAPIFREGEWNDYQIVAIGDRTKVYINGTLFSELIDRQENARDLSGKLAFQLHSGPETRVEFRDILLEDLRSDDSRLGKIWFRGEREDSSAAEEQLGVLPVGIDGTPLNLDFEQGSLEDWSATGDAFQGQPVKKETIASRWSSQVSNKQGEYFIGGYEVSLSDSAQGTLTSKPFKVTAPYASFRIAGGSSRATRVDVLAVGEEGESVIFSAVGDQREQMRQVVVDLRPHQGRKVIVRLIDESSGGWGHLNFDNFRFHSERPRVNDLQSQGPLSNPLLHHLITNPTPANVTGDTLAKMSVPDGVSVELVAAEPRIHQPMAFTFDAKGRLWVVEGHSYPTRRPEGEGLDNILIFEDADGDGVYESRKVFAEGLNLVSGMAVGHGGVWIGAAPYLMFIPDADGDDVPDAEPTILLDGFGYGDTHETINSFIWGPDGWLYGNQGVFNQSMVGKPGTDQSQRQHLAAGVWRYHPTKHKFEVFATGGSNQWGIDFDDHGQLFITHCRSNYGRGSTTHVIQGGHYWTQLNTGYAPYIASQNVAGIIDPNFLLASARYGHGEGGAGKRGSRALYGGHSHVGTMIYLGNQWPAEYRNHLFTHNLHGHRINHQKNLPEGCSYHTVHAGSDVFHCSDRQYIGVDLQTGPDGAVYISDWYDPRHCHSPHTEQWQRGNGRIYRMQYKGYAPVAVDLNAATDIELAELQLHPNEWHVRMARLVLAERAVFGGIDTDAVSRLVKIATDDQQPTRRLRAIWCLHSIGEFGVSVAAQTIRDEIDYVRGWTVQLLAESELTDSKSKLLRELLPIENSPVVKRFLASAAGRRGGELGWQVIEHLVDQSINASDRVLPSLIWQQLAPLMSSDLGRAERLADTCKIESIRQAIYWYAMQLSGEGRELVVARIAKSESPERETVLRLAAHALRDSRNLKQPSGWDAISTGLYANGSTSEAAKRVGAAFGDQRLIGRMRGRLSDAQSSLAERREALAILASDSSPENLSVLLPLIDDPELQAQVVGQLNRYEDMSVADALVSRLPKLSGNIRERAIETLCSRPSSAVKLLGAIGAGEVDKDLITGFYARQMANLGNEEVIVQLSKHWGQLGQSSVETKSAIADLVKKYKEAPLWAYGADQGLYKKLCATCHESTDGAKRIGPKLAGMGAKGIEYIVENVLDPNAVIGEEFLARKILTVDGLVVTGVLLKETTSSVTVRTSNATQTIAKDDIERIDVSKNSFMPEGLLQPLSDRQKIELLQYLMRL